MPEEKIRSTGAQIPDLIYQNIARQIRDGSCLLFLGPTAIAAKQADDSYRPLIELCAEQLPKNLQLPPAEAKSLAQVTSTLRMHSLLSDTMIIAAVQDYYQKAEREAELHPMLEQLADLPFKLIVNTSPDDFFAPDGRD